MRISTRLSTTPRFSLCAFAACLALWSPPAFAAFGSFSIPVGSASTSGGATGSSAILLPSSGLPSVVINFMLPHDYQQNGEVRISLYLAVHDGTPCNARIIPVALIRSRPAVLQVSDLAGLSGGNAIVAFPGNSIIVNKVFTLNPGGALAGQKVGDAFTMQFRRDGNLPTDTCAGFVYVYAINVRYTLAP